MSKFYSCWSKMNMALLSKKSAIKSASVFQLLTIGSISLASQPHLRLQTKVICYFTTFAIVDEIKHNIFYSYWLFKSEQDSWLAITFVTQNGLIYKVKNIVAKRLEPIVTLLLVFSLYPLKISNHFVSRLRMNRWCYVRIFIFGMILRSTAWLYAHKADRYHSWKMHLDA